ncbi:MAG: ribbon-helix-helix protein, CopG family [Alphaproteobacteria bacterium]|nr:ribbon-helix-helix protein, CopG family [Alphaproteobacteria bacterium]
MRTTVDLSDELYRRVKAAAAMRGRKFKDLVEEALRQLLASSEPEMIGTDRSEPSFHDVMQDCCGIATDTPEDYATNPKYMEGFGR